MKIPVTIENPSNTLAASQNISYVLPIIPHVMLMAPMAIIQGIYSKYYGIALTSLALIILLARVADAVTDPIVGYCSDRYRVTHGTRKPFMIVGGLTMLICGFFLYAPPGNVTTLYFGFWSIAFYIAFTLFEIPHVAWPCDLTNVSEIRAKLYSYRAVAGYGGLVCFYSVPMLPIFDTNEITPETLKMTFLIALLLALPSLFQCLRTIPNGSTTLSLGNSEQISELKTFQYALKEVFANRPFFIFMLAFVFGAFGMGMWYGLIYTYVDTYLGMGGEFAKMFLVAFIVGIVVTPLWHRMALRIGKKYAWAFATTLAIASYILTGLLQPGDTTFFQLLVLKTILTCSFAAPTVLGPVILAEIIDYTHWKHHSEKSALYFSIKVFAEKTSIALGVAASLAVAGWFGVDPSVTVQSEESIVGFQAAMVWIPILMATISLLFILVYDFDESRHRLIRKRLDARRARADRLVVS